MNSEKNFLDYIPVRNIDWKKDEEGTVYLVKERTKNKLLKKLIDWFKRDQYFYIHLDDLGTAAWLAIDGKRTVLQISHVMRTQLGDDVVQIEQRVSHFMGMMKRNEFIKLQHPAGDLL